MKATSVIASAGVSASCGDTRLQRSAISPPCRGRCSAVAHSVAFLDDCPELR
jgi:hypothetical protein